MSLSFVNYMRKDIHTLTSLIFCAIVESTQKIVRSN